MEETPDLNAMIEELQTPKAPEDADQPQVLDTLGNMTDGTGTDVVDVVDLEGADADVVAIDSDQEDEKMPKQPDQLMAA